MGLANLVPGVSGGTMLLATGVYPQCIDALSALVTFRVRRSSVALLLTVALSAAAVVLLLAGTLRMLVLDYRWVMYSVFLGATLGGIPVLWRLIGRRDWRTWSGTVTGLGLMVVTTLVPAGAVGSGEQSTMALFLAGLGAFAAMLLPGLSGGYLLVLSGQYIPVLGAVDTVKEALIGTAGPRVPALLGSLEVLVPFAAGCLAALVGMSSLIKTLLRRQRALTLGFLLGLLTGAVIGLWPFSVDGAAWSLPRPGTGLAAVGIALFGFLLTAAVSRLGRVAGSA